MQNEDGYHSGVVVTGSFVNNGTVNGRAGGYGVEVDKNLTQNNVYTATETTFGGPGVDTISMGSGKKIAGTLLLANAKSGGTLKALSDLTVENVTFTVGDATTTTAIDMSQNKLSSSAATTLSFATIPRTIAQSHVHQHRRYYRSLARHRDRSDDLGIVLRERLEHDHPCGSVQDGRPHCRRHPAKIHG